MEVAEHIQPRIDRHVGVPVRVPLQLELHEEFLPSLDIGTGQPLDRSLEPDVPRLSDHHEMDLETLVREAIQLAAPIVPLCRPECEGLCPLCGADRNLGPHAHPDKIQFTEGLPKTRSGKIMRRILRKIAEGDVDSLGDITTLADPAVVQLLVDGRI